MSVIAKPRRRPFSKVISDGILRLIGWRLVGDFPDLPKYIMVGAPHTSNWDFPLALLMNFSGEMGFHWIGKDSLFRWPYGWLFRLTGGIPVWRDRSQNFVEQIIEFIKEADRVVIAIAPEGTRSKSRYWKTGFYYMALGANVPLLLGFVDYPKKELGVGPLIYPSGDIEADFEIIRAFFSQKTGRYPEDHTPLVLKPRSDA